MAQAGGPGRGQAGKDLGKKRCCWVRLPAWHPLGESLHGSEQRGGVVRDVVQVGTDIKTVNHVVGVPLPGHPEVGSRGARSLGSPLPRTQCTYSLPPEAWELALSLLYPLSSQALWYKPA